MTQKLKNIVCALLITAFSTGALAATESASFAASHDLRARKTVVAKKARHRRMRKQGGVITQNRDESPKSVGHRRSRKVAHKSARKNARKIAQKTTRKGARKSTQKNAPMPVIPGSDDANA